MFSQTLALQIHNHSLVCFPVMVCLCWMHTRGTALPDDLRHDSAMLSLFRSHPTVTFLVVWHLPRFASLSHSQILWANFNPSSSSSLRSLAGLRCFRFGKDMLCSVNVFSFHDGNETLWRLVPVGFPHLCLCDGPYERLLSSPLTTNWCPVLLCSLAVTPSAHPRG